MVLITTSYGERWDMTMRDGTVYSNINRAWLVGASLFIVAGDDFYPVNVSDILTLKQYREIKAAFNRRRAWSYAQIYGIGGILAGVLVGTRGSGSQAEKMQQGIKISLISGLITGSTSYIIGGIRGSKRIRIVDHNLKGLSTGKKIRKINNLLESNVE
ncbi:MAG: hypothetical protein H8E14_16530 [Candidatus Marinimicrobia bacterium]|nr:hypothetical protein [Candidatus Neomarinimicrobiota bacterium]